MATVHEKHKWANARLTVGIISIVLFFVIAGQSFVVQMFHALSTVEDKSDLYGMLVAYIYAVAGITAILIRNTYSKGGPIACITLYWFSSVLTFCGTNNFLFYKLWGVIAFIFGFIFLFSILEDET